MVFPMVQEQWVMVAMVVLELHLACCKSLVAALQQGWNLLLFRVAQVHLFAELKISANVKEAIIHLMSLATRVVILW
jgi:hypothetical protein